MQFWPWKESRLCIGLQLTKNNKLEIEKGSKKDREKEEINAVFPVFQGQTEFRQQPTAKWWLCFCLSFIRHFLKEQTAERRTLVFKPSIRLIKRRMSGLIRYLREITPFFVQGTVIHGYRRGSQMLQMPTANLSYESLINKDEKPECGVYFGWTQLRRIVYPSIINIGNNPTYGNDHVTIEVHILNQFDYDFYDEELKVVICGFNRSEFKFKSFEELKQTIHEDARICGELLKEEPYLKYKYHSFFKSL